MLLYVLVGPKTYQHRGINFFYTFNASKIFIKFINNLVISQPIQGNTWDWIKPNISPQLTSWRNKHRKGVASFLVKYKVKVKIYPLSSNEFVEILPNKIPGYATVAAQYFT